MTQLEVQIQNYMDAAFPILYIHTFEEGKAKDAIRNVLRTLPNIQVPEWNGTDRVCDLLTGEMKYDTSMNPLTEILDDRLSCTGQQAIVLGNLDTFMDNPINEQIHKLHKFVLYARTNRVWFVLGC